MILFWSRKEEVSSQNDEIRPIQLLNANGIEGGIHECLVLKYQPSVTYRLIFQYLMIFHGIKWWYITLDVTNGWFFRIWWSWLPPSMPVAKSNWVRPLGLSITYQNVVISNACHSKCLSPKMLVFIPSTIKSEQENFPPKDLFLPLIG